LHGKAGQGHSGATTQLGLGLSRLPVIQEGVLREGEGDGDAVVDPVHRVGSPCAGAPGICMVLVCRMNLIMDIRPTSDVRRFGRVRREASFHVVDGTTRGLTMPESRTSGGVIGTVQQVECTDAVADAVVTRALELEQRYGSTCLRDVAVRDQSAMAKVLGVTRQRVQQEISDAVSSARKARDRAGHDGVGPVVSRKRA